MVDTESGKVLQTVGHHDGRVACLHLTADGRYIIAGGSPGIKVWEMTSGRCEATLQGHGDSARAMDVSRDGRTIASGAWARSPSRPPTPASSSRP